MNNEQIAPYSKELNADYSLASIKCTGLRTGQRTYIVLLIFCFIESWNTKVRGNFQDCTVSQRML